MGLLVCPASGRGAAAKVAGSVLARLRTATDQLSTVVATDGDDLVTLAQDAVRGGVDVLVVLGGDGAAHAAVQACAGTGTALAVVPAGTGNDLATALAMPADPVQAAESVATALTTGHRSRMDLGRVRGGRWFATVLCAGFDSAVSERVNRMRWPSGPRRYDLAIVAELAQFRTRPLVVHTDTGRLELPATLVAVGNTSHYGGGIPICPDADSADGLFDVTVVGQARRRDLLRILPALRSGGHTEHPAVHTMRVRSLELGGETGWAVYADGEPLGPLPVMVECVPGALTVLTG